MDQAPSDAGSGGGSSSDTAAECERVLDVLKQGQRSKPSIRDELGLTKEKLNEIQETLLKAGKVVSYRCRGYGLRLAEPDMPLPEVNQSAMEAAKNRVAEADQRKIEEQREERDLYPYVERWASAAGYGIVKVVGDLHPRSSWENPDLLAVDCYEHEWLIGSEYEITAIEVKLAFDIVGIWQAAHYRRFSHFVYLACYEDQGAMRRMLDGKLLDIAVELGLGILSLAAAGRGLGCFEISSPCRQQPLAREVDRLLNDYASHLELRRPGGRIIDQMQLLEGKYQV
jgi:hypothetical protein